MADITKCSGDDCPLKDKCYRYTAVADEFWQAFFVKPPGQYIENQFVCKEFWGNEEYLKHKIIKKRRYGNSL